MTIDKTTLVQEVAEEVRRRGGRLIEDGFQWHVNHPKCPAGEDRKARLYIKKKQGVFLAYCHHCAESGYYATGGLSRNPLGTRGEVHHVTPLSTVMGASAVLDDHLRACGPVGEFPSWVWREYLGKYFTDGSTAFPASPKPDVFGMRWDKDAGRVVMPIRDETGKLVRVLKRNPSAIALTSKASKVLSYKAPDYSGGVFTKGGGSEPVVVVEDWISACLLSHYTYSAYCLFGCTFNHDDIQRLLKHKHVIVLMDNDPAGREAEKEILARLSLFMEIPPQGWAEKMPSMASPKDCIAMVVKELDAYWEITKWGKTSA